MVEMMNFEIVGKEIVLNIRENSTKIFKNLVPIVALVVSCLLI